MAAAQYSPCTASWQPPCSLHSCPACAHVSSRRCAPLPIMPHLATQVAPAGATRLQTFVVLHFVLAATAHARPRMRRTMMMGAALGHVWRAWHGMAFIPHPPHSPHLDQCLGGKSDCRQHRCVTTMNHDAERAHYYYYSNPPSLELLQSALLAGALQAADSVLAISRHFPDSSRHFPDSLLKINKDRSATIMKARVRIKMEVPSGMSTCHGMSEREWAAEGAAQHVLHDPTVLLSPD